MKLKVQGEEFIYGCYVHSAILPTFHRRSYWLLSNPDVVLVHYLNVPTAQRDSKDVVHSVLQHYNETRNWTREELSEEITPMFVGKEISSLFIFYFSFVLKNHQIFINFSQR